MSSLDWNVVARQISITCSNYWLRSIPQIRECLKALGIGNNAVTPILILSLEHAQRNQKGRAANWLVTAFLLHQGKTLDWLKRNGLLRASTYDFDGTVPRFLAQQVLDHADDLILSDESRSFLIRNLVLLTIASGARDEFKSLMALVRKEPHTLFRSCLATLNLIFMRDFFKDLDFDLKWYSGQGKEQGSKEDLAEGFSFLWSHAYRLIRITDMTTALSDTDGISKGRYYEILKRAAALRQFTSCEVLVNSFDYLCEVTKNGGAAVSPPSPEVEKGIRLGFIENQSQRNLKWIGSEQSGAPSLTELGQRLHSVLTQTGRIRLINKPIARVRFEYPLHPKFLKALSHVGYAKEELPRAEETEEKYGLTPEDTMRTAVRNHLTLHDIRMVTRLSTVLATCVAIELSKRQEQRNVVANSAVITLPGDDALDDLLGMVLKPEAAKEFRNLFRWPPNSDNVPSHFDIQYRPLLNTGNEWQLPIFILCSSDLYRAAFILTGERPGAGENMNENKLVNAFIEAGHLADSSIKLKSGGNVVGEIDVAALIDDTLLILECKDPLLPCSMFELRTSLDHCEKASKQLDRILVVLKQTTQREYILSRLSATGRSINHVVTGIVTGNRLFTGWRVGAHLVTSPGTLMNFIRSGEIRFLDKTAPMRKPGRLTADAIQDYFAGKYHQHIFAAMIPVKQKIELGRRRLELDSYALDLLQLCQQFGITLTANELAEWEHLAIKPDNMKSSFL